MFVHSSIFIGYEKRRLFSITHIVGCWIFFEACQLMGIMRKQDFKKTCERLSLDWNYIRCTNFEEGYKKKSPCFARMSMHQKSTIMIGPTTHCILVDIKIKAFYFINLWFYFKWNKFKVFTSTYQKNLRLVEFYLITLSFPPWFVNMKITLNTINLQNHLTLLLLKWKPMISFTKKT